MYCIVQYIHVIYVDSRQWSCFEKLFLRNNVCEPVTEAFLYRFRRSPPSTSTSTTESPDLSVESYSINEVHEQYGAVPVKYVQTVKNYRATVGRLLRRAELCSALLAASAYACEDADQTGTAFKHASIAIRCFGIIHQS